MYNDVDPYFEAGEVVLKALVIFALVVVGITLVFGLFVVLMECCGCCKKQDRVEVPDMPIVDRREYHQDEAEMIEVV